MTGWVCGWMDRVIAIKVTVLTEAMVAGLSRPDGDL